MVWYPPGSSVTRAHYELYTYHLRSLDHAQPIKSQLGSIEHPMYIRIELCCHLIIQSDIVPFHTQVVGYRVYSF